MHKTLTFARVAMLVAALLILPAVVSAHTPNILLGGYWGGQWFDDVGDAYSGLVSCEAPIVLDASGNPQLSGNPCINLCSLAHTLVHLIMFAMTLTIYAVSPVLLAVGGIFILIAGANPEYVGRGKKILTGTVIGLAITFGAYALVQTLITVLGLASHVAGFGTPFTCSDSFVL